ncbi:MAG: PIG-L domain-containing protein [Chitinophagales bacterium]|nr:MAG: PIG-L domain-containing protein [Chitinophagales bacterium]
MKFRQFLFLTGILCVSSLSVLQAQQATHHAGEIIQMLKKANTLGRVLYIAAHPDDENTRLITYLSKKENLEVAYLSLTRGDGGQNLIGKEQGALLGILRTQELLAARKIDGGIQFFSRANDFGYSKSYQETLAFWDENTILRDMVYVIRTFRPDVIITRFPPLEYNYQTHGHHEASAYLAEKAFALAADKHAFPEQLAHVQPWQPVSLYWNTSPWFYRNTGTIMDTTGKIKIDVGAYLPELGYSCTEIAADSRSQHKSQGFGTAKTIGSEPEYLEYVKGRRMTYWLEGIDTTWGRVKGGSKIQSLLASATSQFNPQRPEDILPLLTQAYALVQGKGDYWSQAKKQQIKSLIASVCGLYLGAFATDFHASPGSLVKITATAINRSDAFAELKKISIGKSGCNLNLDTVLAFNQPVSHECNIRIPESQSISQPYWLITENHPTGQYVVPNDTLGIQPENPPPLEACFDLLINGLTLTFCVPVQYKWTDRVKGEQYRPFIITPAVTIHPREPVVLFADNQPKEIHYVVKAWEDSITGKVEFGLPQGWKLQPAETHFQLHKTGEEKTFSFVLTPPAGILQFELRPFILTSRGRTDRDFVEIAYDHIPAQSFFPTARSKIVKLDLKKAGIHIGYIMGAGDEVAESLRQAGYVVTQITAANISEKFLQQFDAVVVGIRAYNTEAWLPQQNEILLRYVENGGRLVVQYQTTGGLLSEDIGPYPFTIGRDRVTDEHAAVTFLNPAHPLLNYPNKITADDFKNWTQERGLYFPQEWDSRYQTLIAWADPGEPPHPGSILYAEHGKGAFIYTGISFFRQLPAGVPGAYRLFANLIANEYGNQQ